MLKGPVPYRMIQGRLGKARKGSVGVVLTPGKKSREVIDRDDR